MRIAVCNFGRPAPGINNVVDGLLRFSEQYGFAEIIGFIGGVRGMIKGDYIIVDKENFHNYKNQGGGDFLGCSTSYLFGDMILGGDFKKCATTMKKLKIDGLVVTGATHNITSAAYLSEFFIEKGIDTRVVAIPATVDGNIRHQYMETAIGFDSTSKVYS